MKIGLLKSPKYPFGPNWWAWWTNRFSGNMGYGHAAILLEDGRQISALTDGVYLGPINHPPRDWDLIDLGPLDPGPALDWYDEERGCGYDWAGILHFVFPEIRPSPSRWFCSEAVESILQCYGCGVLLKASGMAPNYLTIQFENQIMIAAQTAAWFANLYEV